MIRQSFKRKRGFRSPFSCGEMDHFSCMHRAGWSVVGAASSFLFSCEDLQVVAVVSFFEVFFFCIGRVFESRRKR